MNREDYSLLLISDFNAENFSGYLNNDTALPRINSNIKTFHEVIHSIIEKESWNNIYDFAVIWTQPHSVIESFRHVQENRYVAIDEILQEVDNYCSMVMRVQDRVSCTFVPTWVLPSYDRGLGMLDMKNGIGVANILMRMNLRLSENFDRKSNIFLLNTQKWIEFAGKRAFNPKLWYLAKIPFGNDVFKEAVKDVKAAVQGLYGWSKKLVILDLDDTLWGGVVGDIGWENIRLGGHDALGEAYVDFQKALKSLQNRGILLAIVSKNEDSIALEAINKHPEMVLRLDDFVGWRINWQDKAQNIIDLVLDLNLGLHTSIFIDDNPVERERVRTALPEVLVPEWPQDKTQYKSTLLSLRYFDSPSISNEDLKRTEMYVSEKRRKELEKSVESIDDWLKSLKIIVTIEALNEANLPRVTQLLNKTNQMNLSTRRMTESELFAWTQQNRHKLWAIRVADKFGDSGLTGIISLDYSDGDGRILDFVLSCRIFGRNIENVMLYKAICFAHSIGLDDVYAKYVETSKNKLCLEFLKTSGLTYDEKKAVFLWKTSKKYPLPNFIDIEDKDKE
jgi:FkbH-like protein